MVKKRKKELVTTGLDGLDEITGGGLPPNQLYLVTGQSGSGKTTLAMQFLMEGARLGEKTLYIGTSETKTDILKIADSHGWDVSGIEIFHQDTEFRSAETPLEQTVLHPAEVELPRLMESLIEAIRRVKPKRLVIDSVSEIRLLSHEQSWFRDQILAIKKQTADKCTTIVTDQAVYEKPVLRSLVHGVFELQRETPPYGPDRRRMQIAKLRGCSYASGSHDLKIETGGLRLFPRLIASEHRERYEPEKQPTGVSKLDEMLSGGLDSGTNVLINGPSGSGKSLLATTIVVEAARRGEKSAMFAFDERVQTLFLRARALGMELEDFSEKGLVQVTQIDPAEVSVGEFVKLVMDAVEKGAKIITIDSLNGYSYAMPEENLLTVHLHELSSYLSQQGVTSLFVLTNPGGASTHTHSLDFSYISDTVIALRLYELAGNRRKALMVHKRRLGAHDKTIREYVISPRGLSLGEVITQFRDPEDQTLRYEGND